MVSLSTVFDAAARNASSGSNLTGAASQVIAKRVALGVAAAFDPARADHAEFGRMVPEKMKAFSAAGVIMVQQAARAPGTDLALCLRSHKDGLSGHVRHRGQWQPSGYGRDAAPLRRHLVRESSIQFHGDGCARSGCAGGGDSTVPADNCG